MTDDRNPFSALKEAARAHEAAEHDESLWVQRAAGKLSAQEEAALAQRVKGDALGEHMLAATPPHDEAARDAFERRVLDAVAPSAPVVPLRPKRRWLAAAASLVAAAAAVVLLVRSPAEVVLPRYEGRLEGSDRPVRSAQPSQPATGAVISEGARVRLTARPVDALPAGVEFAARLFVVQDEAVEPVDVPIDIAAGGTVRVSAPRDALFGSRRGALELLLFVGELSALPETSDALAQAESPARGVQVVRFAVHAL